jgi:hypothetical protein
MSGWQNAYIHAVSVIDSTQAWLWQESIREGQPYPRTASAFVGFAGMDAW